ncbi:MAG TPA: methylated-DNA--[protein]-cysteine S-methyltransferase [Candidatus Margulisiibacteriota bacterium]|nr:methylated-DNA--[protein]-cysteine S-methyltransferase [Candidatus Margulisiibacteriota bacterium]
MTLEVGEFTSPIGKIVVAVQGGRLCALRFDEHWAPMQQLLKKRFDPVEFRKAADPAGVITSLARYFAGDFDALDAIGVDSGGTPFQQRVWNTLRTIPAGRTVSYGYIAAAIGAPSAVRAVGAANGSNPVGIVVPCHRVIGSNGQLTGYGGGLERKRWLLAHESAQGELRVAS